VFEYATRAVTTSSAGESMPYLAYGLLSTTLVFLSFSVQQLQQTFLLKRFEVVRVDAEGMRRLPPSVRSVFTSPVPDGELAKSLEDAVKRAGFMPRLLKSPAVSQYVVIDAINIDIKINVSELTAALRENKVEDISPPQQWNGVVIGLHQDQGILTDYGDFSIAQAPPLTLKTPPGFPLDQFFEILFRIARINATQARTLRQNFAANPAAFFPIAMRYEMDNRQVRLNSGSGLLLQNAEKGGELALMWSDGDRSYFLSGLLSEAQAIATGNALQ
jgi:hypothetical protein